MLPHIDLELQLPALLAQREHYLEGSLRSCVPLEPFTTRFGQTELKAQHLEEPPRRLVVAPLEFHTNGTLKGLTLQEPTDIETSVGRVQAERLTFYSDGTLRRVFPTAGKPSATWTDDDEKVKSPKARLVLPSGPVEARLIGLCFYPSGKLRSVTLWPGEIVGLETPLGRFPARIGIAFYESGAIKSFEPARPIAVPTPLGPIAAFHALAVGIHGDSGSVEFTPAGKLLALRSDDCRLTVTDRSGSIVSVHTVREIPSRCEEEATERVPMVIAFGEDDFTVDGVSYSNSVHVATIVEPSVKGRRLPMLCSC
jgi:WD40 repeat protein